MRRIPASLMLFLMLLLSSSSSSSLAFTVRSTRSMTRRRRRNHHHQQQQQHVSSSSSSSFLYRPYGGIPSSGSAFLFFGKTITSSASCVGGGVGVGGGGLCSSSLYAAYYDRDLGDGDGLLNGVTTPSVNTLSSSSSSSNTATTTTTTTTTSTTSNKNKSKTNNNNNNHMTTTTNYNNNNTISSVDQLKPLGPTNIHDGQRGSPQRLLPPKVLPNGGRVTLLGSGPGDPDLLTVAAYELLTGKQRRRQPEEQEEQKMMVISDRLVSQEILDLIPCHNNNTEIYIAQKYPGCADIAQNEIYHWIYDGLVRGMHVIRLKIGDPYVFGRGAEEVLMLRKWNIEPTVIPGVSAAFAAPLLGSIPVTHRGISNQVVMCTGYGRNGTSPDLIQYHKEQTIVFLMAVGRLGELCQRLIHMANYPPNTPIGIIENAGIINKQRTIVGTLSTIDIIATKYNIQPPSTIVVGDVVKVLLSTTTTSSSEEGGEGIVSSSENGDDDEIMMMTTSLSGLIQNATTATVIETRTRTVA